MRHREEWKDWKAEDGMKALRVAMSRASVDWGEISDLLWWARKKEEEEDWVLPSLFREHLERRFPKRALAGSGWYAGERKVWTLGGAEMAMRWIPAGRFLMGAAGDREALKSEKPQHKVLITRGFWIGETPVTQGQYIAMIGENPSHFKETGGDAPVEQVKWQEAATFANRLSVLENLPPCFTETGDELEGVGQVGVDALGVWGWRLPTEAEWEYAARAGTTTPRYGLLERIAWYRENSGRKTHPVGLKEANAWGLYDTLGNVWEWCCDGFAAYSFWAAIDPIQALTDNGYRVLRGGSWGDVALHLRVTDRSYYTPLHRASGVGFRVVRSSP